MAKRMSKQMRKKRTVRVILIVVIVLAVLAAGIGVLQRQVTSQVNAGNAEEVQNATVSKGSIRTVVSGSGNLTDEDVEELTFHGGVEIDETKVEAGDVVTEGQLLATVNMSTVLSAMSDIQGQINDLDEEIGEASGDELDSTIKATLGGRVMKLYAAKGDDVSTVMYENGALALLSLDGYLAVQVETDTLTAGEEVTVTGSDGTAFAGTVEQASGGVAVVLISDEKSLYADTVTVTTGEGETVGSGTLYIHEEMKITGIAGTVKTVSVKENQRIYAKNTLFTLSDTSFSANYVSLLEERRELEEQLQQLIQIYQDGAVLAPMSGTISSIGSSESTNTSTQMSYGSFGTNQTAETTTAEEQTLLSICPGTKMTVSISVDETDILSLAVDQAATISVDALDGETLEGTVTRIDTTATSSGGVTVYTVTVTFDKTEKMLSGMSADVSIVIEGVEDALLIPSEALTQTSSTSYVYTTFDEETGELGGMVEVTTGLNNGSYVEITGGLSENDTVYYFESEEQGFSFGGMGGFGGGFGGGGMPGGSVTGMPSGGGMPDFGGGMPSGMGGGSMPGGNFGGRGQ